MVDPASSVPYEISLWSAKSSTESMGAIIRSTVRKAARLAVYDEMIISVKNHQIPPTIRVDAACWSVRHGESKQHTQLLASLLLYLLVEENIRQSEWLLPWPYVCPFTCCRCLNGWMMDWGMDVFVRHLLPFLLYRRVRSKIEIAQIVSKLPPRKTLNTRRVSSQTNTHRESRKKRRL